MNGPNDPNNQHAIPSGAQFIPEFKAIDLPRNLVKFQKIRKRRAFQTCTRKSQITY